MGMARFTGEPKSERLTISKRAMRRIIDSKNAEIMRYRGLLMDEVKLNEHAIKEIIKLQSERKQYLILSIVATLFGIVGFVV